MRRAPADSQTLEAAEITRAGPPSCAHARSLRSDRYRPTGGWLAPAWLHTAAVFVLFAALSWVSPVRNLSDSRYSLVLSESLLRGTGFALDPYFARPLDRRLYPGIAPDDDLPYQLERVGSHVYYGYPPGSSVLSLPFVAALNLGGVSTIRGLRRYDAAAELFMQGLIASLLMAGSTVVVLLTGRMLLPPSWSLAAVAVAALGTSVWSTASRALWSHTWQIFLLGIVVLLLVRLERGKDGGHPLLMGTLLAWAYVVRPLSLLSLCGVGLYLLCCHRRLLVRFSLSAGFWLVLFVAFSRWLYGTNLPGYFTTGEFSVARLAIGLPTSLISPSRGLLVFSPWLLWVAYLIARYRSRLPLPGLAALALALSGLHLLIVGSFRAWWAGYSYGPRFAADVLPWLILLGLLGLAAWRAGTGGAATRAGRLRWPELLVGALLAILSVLIQAPGALVPATVSWNRLMDVDQHPERVWDWSRPQSLAGFIGVQRSEP